MKWHVLCPHLVTTVSHSQRERENAGGGGGGGGRVRGCVSHREKGCAGGGGGGGPMSCDAKFDVLARTLQGEERLCAELKRRLKGGWGGGTCV